MLIRYPGSKDRQASRILPVLDLAERRLCEPFAGTAAVTFAALRAGLLDHAWLNDADRGIADLWATVRDYPGELSARVSAYKPTADSFYELRDAAPGDPCHNAFTTIVLHQISYSGLGRKAGAPIGGRQQSGRYLVDCRWNASRLTSGIREAHELMARAHVTVTNLDWSDCPDWSWYVDPPYVAAGPALYRKGLFAAAPLADHLRGRSCWVLSYDNAPEIRALYEPWAYIDHGGSTHLGNGRAAELLITDAPQRGVLFTCDPGKEA